jgi:hypothetical protein
MTVAAVTLPSKRPIVSKSTNVTASSSSTSSTASSAAGSIGKNAQNYRGACGYSIEEQQAAVEAQIAARRTAALALARQNSLAYQEAYNKAPPRVSEKGRSKQRVGASKEGGRKLNSPLVTWYEFTIERTKENTSLQFKYVFTTELHKQCSIE